VQIAKPYRWLDHWWLGFVPIFNGTIQSRF
jgi:hypothetical protein